MLTRLLIFLIAVMLMGTVYALNFSAFNHSGSAKYNYLLNHKNTPAQITLDSSSPFIANMGKSNFKLTPKASYKLATMVVAKKKYEDGWQAELAPYDLVFAWGKLTEPKYASQLEYSQQNRWYTCTYPVNGNFREYYIKNHSSNNHIIPANKKILEAVESIRTNEVVYFEGFLVDVEGILGNEIVKWNSSILRSDTGDGACEIFYVNKVVIGNKTYS